MKRAIGIVLILCGLGIATVSIGTQLGYFTILDSGDATPSAGHADALYVVFNIAPEILVIGLGAWLVWTGRTRDAV